MAKTEVVNEKKRVKHELKRYDAAFRQQFCRLPNRLEKEPMRPLYTYYRHLKVMISERGDGGLDEDQTDDLHDGNLGRGPVGRRRSARDSLDFGRRSSVESVPEEM